MRTRLLAILTLFVVISCSKDDVESVSEAYLKLLELNESGAVFSRGVQGWTNTILEFSNYDPVVVEEREFHIDVCLYGRTPKTVSVDSEGINWMVGEDDSGIPVSYDIDNRKCRLVYSFFDSEKFEMYLNIGQVLSFYSDETEMPFVSFEFKKEINASVLGKDYKCQMEGSIIKTEIEGDFASKVLIPSFTFRGERVTVNGVTQNSGETQQDFSKPVEYVVWHHNGSRSILTVDISFRKFFPTIRIDTDGKTPIVNKTDYVSCSVMLEDLDNVYSDENQYEGRAKIKGRGNSTWYNFDKKPYRLKLEEKHSMMGMRGSKNWDLLANYSDKTLLRNLTAMGLSRIVGMPWTPEMKSVELYLNGEYRGVYTLSEHKEVGKHKVNIEVAGSSDVEGGYYFEIDSSQESNFLFWTGNLHSSSHYNGRGIPIAIKDPETLSSAQFNYIKEYFHNFENALYSEDFDDPEKGYEKYIDVDSFISYFFVQELSKNIDGNTRKSSFLSKKKEGKLVMCHVWDFDLAFSNCNYLGSYFGTQDGPEGWFVRDFIEDGRSTGWFGRLFQDKTFTERIKTKWNEIYPLLCTFPEYIDSEAEIIKEAQERNFQKWDILNQFVWPNVVALGNYDKEVQYLKKFYIDRLEWMNKEIGKL